MSESDVLTELERETRSSITFKRSAKQEPYWDIKVYFDSGSDDAAEDGLRRLQRIDKSLRANFLEGYPTDRLAELEKLPF